MARLSVNINKFATLRNARGNNMPCLLDVAEDLISYGVTSLTVHPRPDERHITKKDAYDIAQLLGSPDYSQIEYNIEGYPDAHFLELVHKLRPDQYTLVPDAPGTLTSDAGWKLPEQSELLKPILEKLREANIRSSIFVDPKDVTANFLKELEEVYPDRVELYTGQYAEDFTSENKVKTLETYKKAADQISALGIDINAGHDLNLENLKAFLSALPQCKEVSIGHALVCESLYLGLKNVSQAYLNIASDK